MATFNFTVKDAIKPDMITAVAANYNYVATLSDGTTNPETQEVFVNRMLRQWLRDNVIQYRRNQALANVADVVL